MTTRVQALPEAQKTRGFDQDTHECFMSVSDPTAWMDNSNDLVSNLSRFTRQKEVPGGMQMRFSDGGASSSLSIWSTDGKRCFGHMDGEELVLFLTRALSRLNHRTPANSCMSSPRAAKDLAA